MPPQTLPLDPNSEAGRAAAEALTAFLASVEPKVRRRRQAALAATVTVTQKAA